MSNEIITHVVDHTKPDKVQYASLDGFLWDTPEKAYKRDRELKETSIKPISEIEKSFVKPE